MQKSEWYSPSLTPQINVHGQNEPSNYRCVRYRFIMILFEINKISKSMLLKKRGSSIHNLAVQNELVQTLLCTCTNSCALIHRKEWTWRRAGWIKYGGHILKGYTGKCMDPIEYIKQYICVINPIVRQNNVTTLIVYQMYIIYRT